MNIKNLRSALQKLKKDRITFMIVPHSNATAKTISFSLLFVYSFILTLFLLLTISFFIITRHIDYINTLTHNIVLENKLEYFSKELIKNRNFLSELKNIDSELRILLNMKDKKAIIDANAIGGPEIIDQIIAQKLSMDKPIFTLDEFDLGLQVIHKEIISQLESSKEIIEYIQQQKDIKKSKPSIWPTTGYISSVFGYRVHPISGRTEFHKGIDIANARGTSIIATADGIVRYSKWLGGYGKLVVIEHGHGYLTFYGHLHEILVRNGQKIKKGDQIAKMGNTGVSTGTHLHYEIRYLDKPQNPLNFVEKNN